MAAAAPFAAHAQAGAWRFHADPVLGTSLDLTAVAADRASAWAAAEAARAEIARLDALLSGWRDDSELSRLNSARSLSVSSELFEVLSACEAWRARTGGGFDARQGIAFAQARTGAEPAIVRAAWTTDEPSFDPATRTVFRPDGVRFAPEALAKGYVIDRAMAAARVAAPGLRGLMLDIGGDLRTWGQAPFGGDWFAGLASSAEADNAIPDAGIRLGARGLATSGPRTPGERHILGAGEVTLASAVAPTAADADALATALCAMPLTAGLALVERTAEMEARLVDAQGGVHTSSGWREAPPQLVRIADGDQPAAAPPALPWPDRFGLGIDYSFPAHGSRAYSPYLAVWITDADNRLVRALTMLGGKLDYVSENYIWWRRYGRARLPLVAAITRPTRPAGRYSLAWDGKDDAGQPVGQGRYIVHLEAIREGGLHTYQSVDLTLGTSPVQGEAAGGDELGRTQIRYGRR